MVVCKYFSQGSCRFGSSCRFEHAYHSKYSYHSPTPAAPTQQSSTSTTDQQLVATVCNNVRAALDGNQWLLSCFAPFSKQNLPGLVDVSPEEARLAIYDAKENNTVDQAITLYNNLVQEANLKYRKLLEPDASLVKVLRSVYNQESTQNPFGSPSAVFGGQSAQSVFGGQNNSQNVFNGQSNSRAQTIFGGQSTSVSPQHVFSGQSNGTAQSIFSGQTSSTNPQSVFGAQSNSPTPQSVFGAQSNSPTPQSVFGGPSVFSGQNNPQSVFSTQNSQNTSSNVFSGQTDPKSVFGQSLSQPTQAQSVFVQANQSIFGAPQASQANVFTSQQPFASPNQNVFTKPSDVFHQNTLQSNFSSSQQTPGFAATHSDVFGQRPSEDSDTYSKSEELSPEDLEQFNSSSFEFGFIPELPPPQALCF